MARYFLLVGWDLPLLCFLKKALFCYRRSDSDHPEKMYCFNGENDSVRLAIERACRFAPQDMRFQYFLLRMGR